MAATIREIAEKTGVSITTISQILNGKGERFSDLTREKVLKTAKEMSYKPNFFAKNMIVSHTNTIGMIVPEVTDPFFSQMVKGAEDYLNKEGYMIMLCNSSNDKEREDLYVEELLHRAVDGLIIASLIFCFRELSNVWKRSVLRIFYLIVSGIQGKKEISQLMISKAAIWRRSI